ncbi:protein of unknown function [Rhodovastum atsumiense]|nr:protein of unknown function [Rhodovastum atsumiense]
MHTQRHCLHMILHRTSTIICDTLRDTNPQVWKLL